MKKVKKIIAGLGIMMIIGASSLSIEVFADEMARKLSAEEELLIEPRADEIGWEYKTVGNKVYRRMYNYTKKRVDWRMGVCWLRIKTNIFLSVL